MVLFWHFLPLFLLFVCFSTPLLSGTTECSMFIVYIPYLRHAAAAAKSLQSCPTLCDPMDCSLPGFSVHGILQARTPKWVAISFSNAWKWIVKVKLLSRVWLLATPWTAAYQFPPSIGFSGQEYWSGVPLPSSTYVIQPAISLRRSSSSYWTTALETNLWVLGVLIASEV